MGSDHWANEPVLDFDNALARLGGDLDLFADMAGYAIEDTPKLISDLTAAIKNNDAPVVRMKAHALKGLVAGCGGLRTVAIAQELEDAGENGDLSNANSLAAKLVLEVAQLQSALTPHLR